MNKREKIEKIFDEYQYSLEDYDFRDEIIDKILQILEDEEQ